ncbi:MAG: hypothetical protein GYA02_01720 [Clostridiaceae bacterium]|jgi:hypothetical protein|nr:hypothetical protein [Clostridiaceae bacterium]
MINLQNLKDVLMFKESTTEAQNVFMEEFNDIYQEADKEERIFLENSVDQIFRKYYYSAVQPETYITPANIMFRLVEEETAGKTGESGMTGDFAFFPKIILKKQKGFLSKIQSTLHYVNTERHYMVDDFETVLKICGEGLKVNDFGIPEDSERKKFKDKLFFNDRHYYNTIVLVAIGLGYMKMVKEKNKNLAITTQKSDEFINMTTENKIKCLVDGIIESFIRASTEQFPKLEKFLKKNTVWKIIKNPSSFSDFLDTINDEFGISFELIEKAIYKNEYGIENLKQIHDTLLDNPSSFQLVLFMMMLDMYLFTPLGYYMQLIKPYYSNVYNIVMELGQTFNILKENYSAARNMLFAMPDEYDLTPLGEKIILDGKRSKRSQVMPKKYNDKKFLECFQIREQYLEDELLDFIEDFGPMYEPYNEYDDEYDEYDDEYDVDYDDDYVVEYDDKYDDEYNDGYDDGYSGRFCGRYDSKNSTVDSANDEDNVINLLDYKKKKDNDDKKKPEND